MRPTVAAVVTVLSALLIAPAGATGQAGMFRQDGEARSRQAQIYQMNVRRGINATLTEWREAWQRDDAEAIARLYAEDATVFTDEETIQGREAIAAYYRRVLPGLASRQALPLHFDASGALAYQVDQVTLTLEGDGAGKRTQRQFMVLRQQWDDRWLIESLMASDVVLDASL
jgi:uncharacterized protein (TIGR02246 family)